MLVFLSLLKVEFEQRIQKNQNRRCKNTASCWFVSKAYFLYCPWNSISVTIFPKLESRLLLMGFRLHVYIFQYLCVFFFFVFFRFILMLFDLFCMHFIGKKNWEKVPYIQCIWPRFLNYFIFFVLFYRSNLSAEKERERKHAIEIKSNARVHSMRLGLRWQYINCIRNSTKLLNCIAIE